MRRLLLAVALLAVVSLGARADIVLNIAAVDGATINFSSGTITFPNTATNDFSITSQVGGTGVAKNLNGNLDGTFVIGAVTNNGISQTAPVTGSGTLSIFDGTNTFSSTVNWASIFSTGAAGGLNAISTIANLSAFSYTGSNVDLLQFMAAPTATGTLTYQFTSATDLNFLKTNTTSTSYSGSLISAVPEPASILGLGSVLLLFGAMLRRKKA
jgi:hypothetical protein